VEVETDTGRFVKRVNRLGSEDRQTGRAPRERRDPPGYAPSRAFSLGSRTAPGVPRRESRVFHG